MLYLFYAFSWLFSKQRSLKLQKIIIITRKITVTVISHFHVFILSRVSTYFLSLNRSAMSLRYVSLFKQYIANFSYFHTSAQKLGTATRCYLSFRIRNSGINVTFAGCEINRTTVAPLQKCASLESLLARDYFQNWYPAWILHFLRLGPFFIASWTILFALILRKNWIVYENCEIISRKYYSRVKNKV